MVMIFIMCPLALSVQRRAGPARIFRLRVRCHTTSGYPPFSPATPSRAIPYVEGALASYDMSRHYGQYSVLTLSMGVRVTKDRV